MYKDGFQSPYRYRSLACSNGMFIITGASSMPFAAPGCCLFLLWISDYSPGAGSHEVSADFLAGINADILILQEVDINARRTHRLNIAEEIARKLQMDYVFGREFQELVQGSSLKEYPAYHSARPLCRSGPFVIRA